MRQIAGGKLDTHVVTEGRDEISEMAVALQTFRDTLAETQAELIQAGKLAALGQLAAGVANELNQPLADIRSYAHKTNRLMEKNEMVRQTALNRISGLVERMGGTVNHLRIWRAARVINLRPWISERPATTRYNCLRVVFVMRESLSSRM